MSGYRCSVFLLFLEALQTCFPECGGDFPAKACFFWHLRKLTLQVLEGAAASVRGLKHNVSALTRGFSYNNETLLGFLCGQTFL